MPLWNKFFFLCIGLLFCFFLYLLAPILTPFLTGALLAYLVNPLVKRLMRLKLPRMTSIIIVFTALILTILIILILLIPLIQTQINNLIEAIPRIIEWVQNTAIPYLTIQLANQSYIDVNTFKQTFAANWTKTGSFITIFFTTIFHSGMLILNGLLNFILIPVVTFYLLSDWDRLLRGIYDLLPRPAAPVIVMLAKECDDVLSAFFRGQLLVMLCISIYYSFILSVIGLNIGILLGIMIGLISIVPYLGVIIGIGSASIAALVEFGSFQPVLYVWLAFAIGQILDSFLITPLLVGDRIGLHPVVVIFAVLAGGSLFGFFGVLLALPVAAVIMVLLRFLSDRYHKSPLYR